MVGAKHDPATETVSQVNHGGAAAEADHVGEGCSQGQDEDLAQHHDMEMAWDWWSCLSTMHYKLQQDCDVLRGFKTLTKGLIKNM